MIPDSVQRTAHRNLTVNRIKARPSAARFRSLVVGVRMAEAPKLRDLRQVGMVPLFEVQIEVALPPGTPVPVPETPADAFSIVDLTGAYLGYDIVSVTALQGTDCYLIGLRRRRTAPTTQPPTL